MGTVLFDSSFVPTGVVLSGNEREQDHAAMKSSASGKIRALAESDDMHLIEITHVCCADEAAMVTNVERLYS